MHKLKFALKFIIAIIPFSLLGSTLYSLFPKIPHTVVMILYAALFAFFVYLFYKKKKKIRESDENYVIPEYLKPSTLAYLLIAAIMSFFFTSSTVGTSLVIDNGKSVPVDISIENKKITIPPNSFKQTSIRLGSQKITVQGVEKTINIPNKAKWIFNIDSIYTYYETSVDYSSHLFKNGIADSSYFKKDNIKVLKGELIKSDAEYLFEAPETITIDKSKKNQKIVSVKILYRMPFASTNDSTNRH